MDKKLPIIIATLLGTGMAPAAFAESMEDDPGTVIHENDIEFGVGYVSDTAWKFGQYNGLQDEGAYGILDIHYMDTNEDAGFMEIRGTNLGLESRYLRLDAGIQGKLHYYFVYDELPSYQSNTAVTPYPTDGQSSLTLPAGYTGIADINTYAQPLQLKTKRQRFDIGAAFLTSQKWKFDIKASHETKEGVQQMGSTLVDNTGAQLVGNTYGALLPEPVDYKTSRMDAGLHYNSKKTQVDFIYHVSLFENNNDSLSWQNPFTSVGNAPQFAQFGEQGLAPSNQLHQLSLSGGYNFSDLTRLTGVLSVGRSTQDEDLLPYDTQGIGGALPRSSAEAEVSLNKAGLKLISRTSRKLRLSAEYLYDGRDNNTEVDTWSYTVADSNLAGGTVQNAPLSWKKHKLDLNANYRFSSRSSLRGGYRYDRITRDYGGTAEPQREQNYDNTLYAKWKYRPNATVNLAVYGEGSVRDGTEYNPAAGFNPELRAYYIADRQRGKLGGLINTYPTDRFTLGFKAEYTDDDYNNTDLGVTDASFANMTLDASYLVAENFTTYAYYSYGQNMSKQNGQGLPGGGGDTEYWDADYDDRINTAGIGGKVTELNRKWDIGADLVFTQATGKIDLARESGAAVTQYPDLKTIFASLKFWTTYQQTKKLAYKFSYWIEDYDADNWALDSLEPDSVSNMLLMGEDVGNYRVHVVGASAIYNF